MRLAYALLVDHAEVHDGKHFIQGGGWNSLTFPMFPIQQPLGVALSLELEREDAMRKNLHVALDVVDEDGISFVQASPVIGVKLPPLPDGITVLAVPLCVGLAPAFTRAGRFAVTIAANLGDDNADEHEVGRIPFVVKLAQAHIILPNMPAPLGALPIAARRN